MNCAIVSPDCHLNPLVEKQRKNEGLRLFSAEDNKRGLLDIGVKKNVETVNLRSLQGFWVTHN
jgi:hypothetical protein